MTSDAKVGLLLGLVFIFIIAFIINGLPGFHKDANSNELTTNISLDSNRYPGLAVKERRVQEIISRDSYADRYAARVEPATIEEDNVRFEVALPNREVAEQKTQALKTLEIKQAVDLTPPAAVVQKATITKKELDKRLSARSYTVADGDSLAAVAKKMYGPEQGNRRVNIQKIFEANRAILRSEDEIRVGQKLIVPPLYESKQAENKGDNTLAGALFEKVKSIGQSHLLASDKTSKQNKRYTVRQDDSLWEIATEQLGNGARYNEIVELNKSLLPDEDSLGVGMSLVLPNK